MNDSVDQMTEDLLNDEDLALFASINLGESARAFVESPVGRFMIGALKQDIEDDMQKLYHTPLWRKRKCQAIKNDIKVREHFLLMLNEAFTTGDLAHQAMVSKMQEQSS